MKYNIPSDFTLREVYLMYLIAIEPAVMLEEHGLNAAQVLLGFRNANHYTWGDFMTARNQQS